MKKKICKTLLILLSSIGIGIILLLGVYLLPTGRMKGHVESSVSLLEQEGKYKEVIEGVENTKLDNYTDSIMLANAIYDGNENVLDKAMHVYRYSIDEDDAVKALSNIFSNEEEIHLSSYDRYWHGYLVVLKPVLMFFNYSNIRLLNTIIQPILIALVAILLFKKKKEKYIIPYLISILMVNPSIVMMSLQYSTIFYITNISLIALLLLDDKLKLNNSYIYYFLIVGIITSYMDFLTYPLVTLGFPLIVYFILKEEKDLWTNVKSLVANSFMWGVGYIGMWVGKFLFGTILTFDNMFKSALGAIETRTSLEAQETNITPFSVIRKNLDIIMNKPYVVILLLFILFAIILFIINKDKITKEKLLKIVPYLLIACIPFAWFTVTGNHSYIHAFFTHRILIITIFAILASIVSIIDLERKNINESKTSKRNKKG